MLNSQDMIVMLIDDEADTSTEHADICTVINPLLVTRTRPVSPTHSALVTHSLRVSESAKKSKVIYLSINRKV